jgi:Protein of unknown function (DUF2798)
MSQLPASRFHLVFSVSMAAIMVFFMTFVITAVNVGWPPNFLALWVKAFAVAYPVAVPVIYFTAPLARRITARIVHMPPPAGR